MRKLVYIIYIAALTPFLTGCFEDPGTDTLITEKTDGFVEIVEATGAGSRTRNVIVVQDGEGVTESINVSFGGAVSDEAVELTYEVDAEASTAVQGVDFEMITSNPVTIPAGEYTSPIQFEVNDDLLDPETPLTITFNLVSASVPILEAYKSVTITIVGLCPPDLFDYESLVGTYTSISSGESTGPCTGKDAVVTDLVTTDIEITRDPENDDAENNLLAFRASEMFGGLYIYWYDCFGYTFRSARTFFVNTETGEVSGTVRSAFFNCCGDEFPLEGFVDACNGDINIDWTNVFGDTGDMLYAKQ